MTRLKPGVSRAMANAEFQSLLEQFAKQTPTHFPEHFRMALEGLNDHFVTDIGGAFYLLLSPVAFLLLATCGKFSLFSVGCGPAPHPIFPSPPRIRPNTS